MNNEFPIGVSLKSPPSVTSGIERDGVRVRFRFKRSADISGRDADFADGRFSTSGLQQYKSIIIFYLL